MKVNPVARIVLMWRPVVVAICLAIIGYCAVRDLLLLIWAGVRNTARAVVDTPGNLMRWLRRNFVTDCLDDVCYRGRFFNRKVECEFCQGTGRIGMWRASGVVAKAARARVWPKAKIVKDDE